MSVWVPEMCQLQTKQVRHKLLLGGVGVGHQDGRPCPREIQVVLSLS